MIKEFRKFIAQGNVIDLAVGVLVGGAFNGLVASLTKNLLSPLLGLFTNSVDLSALSFQIGATRFTIGSFLNDTIQFIITMFVIFLIVKSVNKLRQLTHQDEEPAEPTSDDYLKEIRDLLVQNQDATVEKQNDVQNQ